MEHLIANDHSKCCNEGAKQFLQLSTCSKIHNQLSGALCIRTASICCLRALLDQSCHHGMTLALEQDNCPANINQIGGGFRKECCECCLLAKDLLNNGEECVAPSGLSTACNGSFNKCCKEKNLKSSSAYFLKMVSINEADGCSTAKCDHFCNDYGEGTIRCSCREDIDECLSLADNCHESQRCLNTPGSFKCIRTLSCGTGYALNSETEQCTDIDECHLGSHDCGPTFVCRNTQGSYRCDMKICPDGQLLNPETGNCTAITCPVGYKATKGACEDINECTVMNRPCNYHEECINTPGSYKCQLIDNLCGQGYRIDKKTGFCIDIDECAERIHTCGTEQCVNILGSYKCRCAAGYEFNETLKNCEDVDECKKFDGHVCSLHATCENTIGSFKCHCKSGFRLAADARGCEDINECDMGIAVCSQKCINIPGSYQCLCDRGFQLSADGSRCEDIDECVLWSTSDDELCMGSCINTPGSYRCKCPSGYTIQDDGRTCKDIDECQQGFCRTKNTICVNTLGSFKCHRIECPTNYVHDKHYKNRCNRMRYICEKLNENDCKEIPLRISWEYTAIPRNEPISKHRTSIMLFTVKGPSSPSASVQFELNLKSAIPENNTVRAAIRSNFLLQKGEERNLALISLRDSLDGPQEIELELILRLSVDGTFQSKYIANLIVYVSAHRRQRMINIEDGYSCLKECDPRDAICLSNHTKEILYQFRAIPSMKNINRPIEISRITTEMDLPFSVDYQVDKMNRNNFFVVQERNIGVIKLSSPLKGPQVVMVRIHINTYSRTRVLLAHNVALIRIYISPNYF
ncbi:unnamed protein product [Dracunculus medinensis]|uniref:Fibulin-1 n=1 Tax=Dracunculus medinensis TaxID=318479 RepID=A0A158Q686_DRAME|nr:unnamed protein product [Dracunculus medinensis]